MIDFVNRKLMEWAEWRAGGRVALLARPSIYFRGPPGDGYTTGAAVVPIDSIEADRTHTCVLALEPTLQRTLEEFYGRNITGEMMASHLGITRKALYKRVDRAHVLLLGYMNDLAAGLHVEPWHEQVRRAKDSRLTRYTESV